MRLNVHYISLACLFVVQSYFFSSCIKDEMPNSECDILTAYVEGEDLSYLFSNENNANISVTSIQSDISFKCKKDAEIDSMVVFFTLTPGATITPESGSKQDFSKGKKVIYTTESEDGKWHRTYKVSFRPWRPIFVTFSFENFQLTENITGYRKYYDWFEIIENDESEEKDSLFVWASGNSGFYMAKSNANAYEYPTCPLLGGGYEGDGVQLTTQSTGSWGAMMNKRIAAGNLFLGEFDPTVVLTNPLKATCFGINFYQKPILFKGYYKYSTGETYTDANGNIIENVRDSAAIYSVLYRNTDKNGNAIMLHGDDVMTNPNIIAIARVPTIDSTEEWKEFEVEFNYTEDLDQDLLDNGGYNITVVFSSSKEGDNFKGAVGSTLCIDEVEVVCEEESSQESNNENQTKNSEE